MTSQHPAIYQPYVHQLSRDGLSYAFAIGRVTSAIDLSTARGYADLTEREQIDQALQRQLTFIRSLAQSGAAGGSLRGEPDPG